MTGHGDLRIRSIRCGGSERGVPAPWTARGEALEESCKTRAGRSAGRPRRGHRAAVTRQTTLPTSSATSSAPRASTATPTGRPQRVAVLVDEAGEDVLGHARRACRRRTARRSPCSRSAACGSTSRAGRRTRRSRYRSGRQLAAVERETERGGVRAERVVRHDRLRDEVGPPRLDTRSSTCAPK